ncbi:MAG: tetratricopeptide repeat protein [Gemmataceae bacterium]
MAMTEEKLLALIRKSGQRQPIPDEPHVAQDASLLASWADGHAGQQTLQRIFSHLARCYQCRQELKELIAIGALELCQGQADVTFVAIWRRVTTFSVVLALAASIFLLVWIWPPLPELGPVDRLQSLVESQQYAQALDYADQLPEDLDPKSQKRVVRLLEKSGYQLAKKQLAQKHFDKVSPLLKDLARQGIDSGRLSNLRLQSEDGVPTEMTLASVAPLTEFGYEVDGFAPAMGLPMLGAKAKKQRDRWEKAVQEHPDSVRLRLNLGYVLLKNWNESDLAGDQFGKVLELDQENTTAHLGLGIVAFQKKQYEKAKAEFVAALKSEPNNPALHLNLAMTLEQLGQQQAARDSWHRFLSLSDDERLSAQVRDHLKALD